MKTGFSTIILAAGEGTRMKSSYPKVLHPLCGKPMLARVLDTILALHGERNVLVLGFGRGSIEQFLQQQGYKTIEIAVQDQQFGSGHAVAQAAKLLKNYRGDIIVICADVPLIKAETLKKLLSEHRKQQNSMTVLTTAVSNPTGYGRIVRRLSGEVEKIVEEKDALSSERLIKEINSGIYCFQAETLFRVLPQIKPDNAKKEYYLTDVLSLLRLENLRVGAMLIEDSEQIYGINDRVQLAQSSTRFNQEKLTELMMNGVTILDPKSVWVDSAVLIGQDTVIYPGTMIAGKCNIGKNCSIGPHSFIQDSLIGDDVEIRASFLYEAEIGNKVKIGPFAHIRPKTKVEQEARIGNFVEVKKAKIGKGSKISHLTYIGDATLGKEINIGAGVITCNYDGIRKQETFIEDKVFVGSNVNLVAPVKIGRGAIIGAGSTITENVPAGALALARSQQINKKRWAADRRNQKLKIKNKVTDF